MSSEFYTPKPASIDQEAARALRAHPTPWRIELHSGRARAAIRDRMDIAVFTGINIAKAC